MAELNVPTTALQSGDEMIMIRGGAPANVVAKDGATKAVGTTAADLAQGDRGLPTGGTVGQALVKTGVGNYLVGWGAASGTGLPAGGVAGDVLKKTSSVDGAASWSGGFLEDADIGATVQGWKAVLDATTASFTTGYKAQLDGMTNVLFTSSPAAAAGILYKAADSFDVSVIDEEESTATPNSILYIPPVGAPTWISPTEWNVIAGVQPHIPQNSKSAAYTLVLADANSHLYHPGADTTARIWTIPANSSVAYPIGTWVTFVNDTSAGAITVAITSDTLVLAGTGTTGSRTLAANGIATAIKTTSTRWMISGTGLT